MARSYTLGYANDSLSGRSLLTSVTETGADGISRPPTMFQWEKGAFSATGSGWKDAPGLKPPVPLSVAGFGDFGRRMIDINADGLTDIIWHRRITGTNYEVGAVLNTGSGWTTVDAYRPPTALAVDGEADMGRRFVDLNGDGLLDLVYGRKSGTTIGSGVYLNTGTGWLAENTRWAIPGGFISQEGIFDSGRRFEDLDGDGRADLIWCFRNSAGQVGSKAFINNGTHFVEDRRWELPVNVLLALQGVRDLGKVFLDVNKDGLPDLIWNHKVNNTTSLTGALINRGTRAAATTGSAWGVDSRWVPPTHLAQDGVDDSGRRFVDVNNEGSSLI